MKQKEQYLSPCSDTLYLGHGQILCASFNSIDNTEAIPVDDEFNFYIP